MTDLSLNPASDFRNPNLLFQGFTAPEQNWTRLPNALIDALPLIDSLSELKVILYTLRHTWGFQEYESGQQLTIDEYMSGKRLNDGRRIDGGTGMSKPSIMAGIKNAIEHGFLEVQKQGRLRNYRPNMKNSDGKDSLPKEKFHNETEGKTSLPSRSNFFTLDGKTSLPSITASESMASDSEDRLKKQKEIERNNTGNSNEFLSASLIFAVENSKSELPISERPQIEKKSSAKRKPREPTARDSVTNTIAFGASGMKKGDSFNASQGAIIIRDQLGDKPTNEAILELADLITRMYVWHRQAHRDLDPPAKASSVIKYLNEFKQKYAPPPDPSAPIVYAPNPDSDNAWVEKYLERRKAAANGQQPTSIHQPGRKDSLLAGPGTGWPASREPEHISVPTVPEHGSRDPERTD